MGALLLMPAALPDAPRDDYTFYAPSEAARLALLHPERLRDWEERKIVSRSRTIVDDRGRAVSSGYSLRDVAYMHLLLHLRSKGVPMEDAVLALYHVMARIDSDPEAWRELSIVVSGKTVYVRLPNEWGQTQAVPGPQGAGQKIEDSILAGIFTDVAEPGLVLVPVAFRPLIEIHPRRCEGHPSFKDSGISVFHVVNLLNHVGDSQLIREYYPSLRREHLRAGRHYVRYLDERRI